MVKDLIAKIFGGKTKEQVLAEAEMDALRARVVKGKEILKEWEKNKTVLGHVQLHLLAQSLGLEIRHYTEFLGKTPAGKIFQMPKLKGSEKIQKITDYYNAGWTGIIELLGQCTHGLYATNAEVAKLKSYINDLVASDPKNEKTIQFFTVEYPAVFILAPTELFTPAGANKLMDPIVVEMVGPDQYQVQSFWNVPEGVAVHMANPSDN